MTEHGDGVRAWLDPNAGLGATWWMPFRRVGLRERVLRFAVVAVVAQASLFLPPGIRSVPALVVSLVLLAAVVALFWLPWHRAPAWLSVVVPLTYTGSLLALILATGQASSGIGIVVLVPLAWTALFHRPWESFVVVGAIVAVELVTAQWPVPLSASTVERRVFFWSVLGVVVSLAIHALRGRARRAHAEIVRLTEQLRERAVLEDRERIASELSQSVMQKLVAVEFHLAGTISHSGPPFVGERVQYAVDEIDDSVRQLRAAIFKLETQGLDGRRDPQRSA